ncbi:MAG: hypothetical protein F2667_05240 [Actinobacteria bacterium]|uniref:Unannotated protein n=1 Tax=freshwater metagenome TaxID=449393 RepID=A0A6J6PUE2_9ZZZZ|nr:hypothetical protein [Actinomycetota bacterium]
MPEIEELLHRRSDLSTFLVHLTRAGETTTARENLVSMIAGGQDEDGIASIQARSPYGPARDYDDHLGLVATQKAVCFTETPLEHIWMMLKHIERRTVHFEPWGLVTTKAAAREAGCSPVWYTNKAATNWTTNPIRFVRRMIDDALARSRGEDNAIIDELLQQEPVFRITPFVEDMGRSRDGVPKEFWWEREWRHVGDYSLQYPSRFVAILAPEAEHESLRAQLAGLEIHEKWKTRSILDPNWGLERMIATLSGVNSNFVGPFPS